MWGLHIDCSTTADGPEAIMARGRLSPRVFSERWFEVVASLGQVVCRRVGGSDEGDGTWGRLGHSHRSLCGGEMTR